MVLSTELGNMEMWVGLAILIGFVLIAAVLLGVAVKLVKFAFDNAITIVIVLLMTSIIIGLKGA